MAVITPTTSTARRPNRILIVLAAAWMAISLAIGGTAMDIPSADPAPPAGAAAGQPAQP